MLAVASPSASVDFTHKEITGAVIGFRELAENFCRVDLADGRAVVGEFVEEDFTPGVAYRFLGGWASHPRYGPQFRAESFVFAREQSEVGIVAFLHRSDLGLTKTDARRLWKRYGKEAVEVLRVTPAQVVHDGVLDADKAKAAGDALDRALDEEPTRLELFELFAGKGIPKGVIRAAIDKWGKRAPAVIRRDPFRLLTNRIAGIGFKRADQLYLDLGHSATRLKRQTLAAWHYLAASSRGDTWERQGPLYAAICKAAGGLMGARFADAIRLGVRSKWLAQRGEGDSAWVADRGAAVAEERAAKHVLRILKHAPAWPEMDGLPVSAHQLETALAGVASPFWILAGTPGTGKTYVAAAILQRIVQRHGYGAVSVSAPTGKAAVRITEAMQRYGLSIKATTIHSLLGPQGEDSSGRWRFRHDEATPLKQSFFVVDESSMKNTDLAASFFAAIPPGANVLLVGDPYQLPPVGHGAPLRDFIASGAVPCCELTELQRNSGDIVKACRAIKDGKMFAPTVGPVDFKAGRNLRMFDIGDRDEQASAVLGTIRELAKLFDPVWDVQILVATNEIGPLSRVQLNATLQEALNPATQPDGRPVAQLGRFRLGDKVICTNNNRTAKLVEPVRDVPRSGADFRATGETAPVANGDMGRVVALDRLGLIVEFFSPTRVIRIDVGKKRRGDDAAGGVDLDLAYALTVHKAQGSESPVIVVVIDFNAGNIGCREWIYTAISRAKTFAIVIGPSQMVARFIARRELGNRKTFLRELIVEGNGGES